MLLLAFKKNQAKTTGGALFKNKSKDELKFNTAATITYESI